MLTLEFDSGRFFLQLRPRPTLFRTSPPDFHAAHFFYIEIATSQYFILRLPCHFDLVCFACRGRTSIARGGVALTQAQRETVRCALLRGLSDPDDEGMAFDDARKGVGGEEEGAATRRGIRRR